MTRLSVLLVCLIGLAAPAFAQADASAPPTSDDATSSAPDVPAGPPVASRDVLGMIVDACTTVSTGAPDAYDQANNAGWTPNETGDTGPFNSVYSGSKDVAGYGEVDVWGSVQNFPTQRLGYCRVDFSDSQGLIDFNDLGGLHGLSGSVKTSDDDNVYGVWESPDKKLLVIADRTDGQVEIEFNLLLGGKPAQG